jgi:hypothetical protein
MLGALSRKEENRMAQNELCQIVLKWKKGNTVFWWEARQAAPQGEAIIAKSSEIIDPINAKGWIGSFSEMFLGIGAAKSAEQRKDKMRAANSELVAQLLAKGWEPSGMNNEGLIIVMRRTSPSR